MPMPMMPRHMPDDDYQAEMDLHTMQAAKDLTPEREAKARTMASKKARELDEMAQAEMPRKKDDMMARGYRVLKGE